jgi:hypothetical protein
MSEQSPDDAAASPFNTPPLPSPFNTPLPSGIPGGMRSIYERMTKPTSQDMQVNERLRQLSRSEIDRIMNHFGMVMEHLAVQRDDVTVKRSQDAIGWTIRVELKTNVPSPVSDT